MITQRPTSTVVVFDAPSGACPANSPQRYHSPSNTLYGCQLSDDTATSGTWVLIGGAGAVSNGASANKAAVALNSDGTPSSSTPLPANSPVVATLPLTTDPLAVPGQYVIFNGTPYIFTAGLSGPPGYWAIDVTGAPNIRDTWANLSSYPASGYPVGTVFNATDRTVSYAVQDVSGTKTWIYYNGIFEALLANKPSGLGLESKGLIFRASDYLHNWLWTGTAWSLRTAAQIGFSGGIYPGTMLFGSAGPPFGGTGALWHLCDGATVNVSQEDASVVSTVLPTISNTYFAR